MSGIKILYVSPENVTGGFRLFAKGHKSRGNECRWITHFKSNFEYDEDLCFNLKFSANLKCVKMLRNVALKQRDLTYHSHLEGNPPIWNAPNKFAKHFFRMRDKINTPIIERTIEENSLNDFDIYHFEQGMDPYRDCRWVKKLHRLGKPIVCFYHGSDLRSRGVLKEIYDRTSLNLTSEIDLLPRIPNMKYLFLPIDTDELVPVTRNDDGTIRIAHAARNRWYKGSDDIERIVLELKNRYPIEWVMIENVPYKRAIEMKASCDIFIDQITDRGGWGYGASSVEALSLGLATLSLINPNVDEFLGKHPFINVNVDTLERRLVELIEDPDYLRERKIYSRKWVMELHSIDVVIDRLYKYYAEAGII